MTFLTILGVTEILCSFRLVLEGKTGTEIPESSRLQFSEKFSANNFALPDAEDNTSRPLTKVSKGSLPILTSSCHVCLHSHKMLWFYWLDGLEGPLNQPNGWLTGFECPLRGEKTLLLEQKNLDSVLKSIST